jgi:ADP-ribose pyrophosphatase YjhB (NUDIX family)
VNRSITALSQILRFVTHNHPHPTLPHPLFLIGTYFFPQVNIELIIRVNSSQLLFSWRDDAFGNKGWHLPGSIVRPNEPLKSRILKLINTEADFLRDEACDSLSYVGFSEVLSKDLPCIRSHFISHIYLLDYTLRNDVISSLDGKYLLSSTIPEGIIENHLRYLPLLRKCILGHKDISPSEY